MEGEESLFVGGEWGKCLTALVEEGGVKAEPYHSGIPLDDSNLRLPAYDGDLLVS